MTTPTDKPSRPWAEWPEYKALKANSRVVPHPGVTVRIFPNPRRNKVEKSEHPEQAGITPGTLQRND